MRLLLLSISILVLSFSAYAQELGIYLLSENDVIKKEKFQEWQEYVTELHLAITDPDEIWVYKSTIHRWNRFTTLFDILPKNTKLVEEVFVEAVRYEPHSFCTAYQEHKSELLKVNQLAKSHFASALVQMDSICRVELVYDSVLIAILKEVDERDLKYRKEGSELSPKQRVLDYINLIVVRDLIKKNGYPGRAQVGMEYENSAWLVLQHNDLEVLEEYLPLIKEQINNRNLNMRAYAYMYDRICMYKGLPQVYGTQEVYDEQSKSFVLYEVKDLENLDKRRYSCNLWGLKDTEEYVPVLDGR